jgi:hypothetical protein
MMAVKTKKSTAIASAPPRRMSLFLPMPSVASALARVAKPEAGTTAGSSLICDFATCGSATSEPVHPVAGDSCATPSSGDSSSWLGKPRLPFLSLSLTLIIVRFLSTGGRPIWVA